MNVLGHTDVASLPIPAPYGVDNGEAVMTEAATSGSRRNGGGETRARECWGINNE